MNFLIFFVEGVFGISFKKDQLCLVGHKLCIDPFFLLLHTIFLVLAQCAYVGSKLLISCAYANFPG